DQVKPAELLARFGERSVGDQPLTIAHADAGRARHRAKRRRSEILTLRLQIVGEPDRLVVARFARFVGVGALFAVHEQHVFHRVSPGSIGAAPPAIAPTTMKGSLPFATGSGTGTSGDSFDKSSSHA